VVVEPAAADDGCSLSASVAVDFHKRLLLRKAVEASTVSEFRDNIAFLPKVLVEARGRAG